MMKLLPILLAALLMTLSSGVMLYSVVELRGTVRLDPELERLAIEYFQFEEARRAYARQVDSANRAMEEGNRTRLPESRWAMEQLRNATPNFGAATSPDVKPRK